MSYEQNNQYLMEQELAIVTVTGFHLFWGDESASISNSREILCEHNNRYLIEWECLILAVTGLDLFRLDKEY